MKKYLLICLIILFPSPVRATSSICTIPTFTAQPTIATPNFTYPSVLKTGNQYLMFIGGLTSQLPSALTTDPARRRYPISQEEIWRTISTDLNTWSEPTYSFGIAPETPISFKSGQAYQNIFPAGFKSGCTSLPNARCNVQINDPTVVTFNNSLYLYFSLLENYRWFDGTLGTLSGGNPTHPELQNIHSLGLAVSSDQGKNWAFVDKVIPEDAIDDHGEHILGAWSPTALVKDPHTVDLYFHDALGTKQYVAHMTDGISPSAITRLNPSDHTYRTNLDVISYQGHLLAAYNNSHFDIALTSFTSPADFGLVCPETIVVPASAGSLWPTPNLFLEGDRLHLFFWQFQNPSMIDHWSAPTTTSSLPGDLNTDGRVDIFDYNLLVSKFGNPYTIFDYNNLVANFGK